MPRNTAGKLNFARSRSARPILVPRANRFLSNLLDKGVFNRGKRFMEKVQVIQNIKFAQMYLKRASELEPELHRALLS